MVKFLKGSKNEVLIDLNEIPQTSTRERHVLPLMPVRKEKSKLVIDVMEFCRLADDVCPPKQPKVKTRPTPLETTHTSQIENVPKLNVFDRLLFGFE